MLDRTLLHLPGDHLRRPHENCYWLIPGRIMAGEYPRTAEELASQVKLAAILEAGIRQFIDLTEATEPLEDYCELLNAEAERLGVAVQHARHPIKDMATPTTVQMMAILRAIQATYTDEVPLYVHCWGGIGRTGTVIGCLLVECGMSGDEALNVIAQKWTVMAKRHYQPRSPETDEQARFVRNWADRRARLSSLHQQVS